MLESFPVESHLNHFLHNHLNAEIVSGTIQTKQDCIDWLTWTFIYRRLLQNPNYYDMKGKSNVFLNDYLSELVENTLMDLAQAKCVNNNENEITPLNLGKIAAFYYVKYNTIDLFSQSLNENSTKLGEMLQILKSAYEFDDIPCHKGDEKALCEMARELPFSYLNEEMKSSRLRFNFGFVFRSMFTKPNRSLCVYMMRCSAGKYSKLNMKRQLKLPSPSKER